MTEHRVRWPDLKQGLTLATGQTHRIVIEPLPVDRLEIEDEYSGDAQAVAFSDDELWKQLCSSHEGFAKTLRDRSFDPETDGDGINRHPGLGVLIVALRFLDQNQGRRLLVAGHTAARARRVLAVLEGDREAFVKACRDLHADEDDSVSDETRGATFDVYQDDLARIAGSEAELETLRGRLRFVSAQNKFLACSQGNRRVELLFFEPPAIPDPADERTPDLIYKRKLFRFEALDPGDLPRPSPASDDASGESVAIVDAPSPEPGVGDPEEPLETQMASLGESDGADPWAFLEPFDSTQPAVG